MSQLDEQQRILQEWLQLPETRRRHATDVVAFAYRLLQERPELAGENPQYSLDRIVGWLSMYVKKAEAG